MIKFELMKNSTIKFIFLFLVTTFSVFWISEKLTVFLEKEKYSYFETNEKNEVESKVKTLFINQIELFDLDTVATFDSQNSNTFYSFIVKEFIFKNLNPPPELL
jgi:hypothetical protein